MNRGFTIVELLVSMAIFVTMTSVIVAKFGNFNQSTLLTDTAYDIALVARLAQTYGLSVKASSQGSDAFDYPYGVDFNNGTAQCGGSATSNPTTLVLFADSYPATPDGICGSSDTSINTYLIIRGASIFSLCVGTDASNCHTSGQSVTRLNVSFQRPNPEAIICRPGGSSPVCGHAYAEAVIHGSDGGARTIIMRQNGQISVSKQ